MSTAIQPDAKAARLDGAAALLFVVLSAAFLWAARLEAAEAVRLYGHNTDSGVYLRIVALVHFIPAAGFFVLSSIGLLRGWRAARFLHSFAVGWVVLLGVTIGALAVGSLFGI